MKSSTNISINDELELYPLRLVICSCDDQGNIGDRQRDLLFSKVSICVCVYEYIYEHILYIYIYT